jgi:hypothetical protein
VSATVLTRAFWPVGQAAQADYESLRTQILSGGALPDTVAAARFARRGMAGLIAWPTAEPIFRADLVGASRPKWTPRADPRVDALAAGFALLLDIADAASQDAIRIELRKAV